MSEDNIYDEWDEEPIYENQDPYLPTYDQERAQQTDMAAGLSAALKEREQQQAYSQYDERIYDNPKNSYFQENKALIMMMALIAVVIILLIVMWSTNMFGKNDGYKTLGGYWDYNARKVRDVTPYYRYTSDNYTVNKDDLYDYIHSRKALMY